MRDHIYHYMISTVFNVFVNWFDVKSTTSRTTCMYMYIFSFFSSFFFVPFNYKVFAVSTVFFKYMHIWNIQSGRIVGSRYFNPFICSLLIVP